MNKFVTYCGYCIIAILYLFPFLSAFGQISDIAFKNTYDHKASSIATENVNGRHYFYPRTTSPVASMAKSDLKVTLLDTDSSVTEPPLRDNSPSVPCFRPIVSLSHTFPDCADINANNGILTITGVTNMDKYSISTGSVYTGVDYDSATVVGTLPVDILTGIPNVGGTYTVRIFNHNPTCVEDVIVTIAPTTLLLITGITAVPTACNSTDNTYNLAVTVTFSAAPTGNIDISVADITRTFSVSGSLSQTFTFTNLPSNGIQNIDLKAALATAPTCIFSQIDAYNAPLRCIDACCTNGLYSNNSFELGNWTGIDTFISGVSSTQLPYTYRPSGQTSTILTPWEFNNADWVESVNAADGNRFVYMHSTTANTAGIGRSFISNEVQLLNQCKKYKVCFDWASFNKDYPNGRAAVSQPTLDLAYKNATNTAFLNPLVTIPLSSPMANQDWNNLVWTHVEYEFTLPYDIPAPGAGILEFVISESSVNQNGILFDNMYFCETSNVVSAGVVAGDQTLCLGGDPVAFTVTTPATGADTLAYQWQSSTTNCTSGFSDITTNGTSATYDPPSGLSQTTYYRLIVTNTSNSVNCSDTTNCITVAVTSLSTPSITSAITNVCPITTELVASLNPNNKPQIDHSQS